MALYRFYWFGSDGHIKAAENRDCGSDEEARRRRWKWSGITPRWRSGLGALRRADGKKLAMVNSPAPIDPVNYRRTAMRCAARRWRISRNCQSSRIGIPTARSRARRTSETPSDSSGRHTEDCPQASIPCLLHPSVHRDQERDGCQRAEQRFDRQRIVEVDRHAEGAVGNPTGDAGTQPAEQMDQEADRQPQRMAVDQRQFRLKHLDSILRVLEPPSGDAPTKLGEQRRGALLQPDQRHACHHRKPEPDLHGHGQDNSGARASKTPRPMAVKASWARNSAVTSTTVEAVASDHDMP